MDRYDLQDQGFLTEGDSQRILSVSIYLYCKKKVNSEEVCNIPALENE